MQSGGLFGRLFSEDGVPDGYLINVCPLGTGILGILSVFLLTTAIVDGVGIDVPLQIFCGTGNCLERTFLKLNHLESIRNSS